MKPLMWSLPAALLISSVLQIPAGQGHAGPRAMSTGAANRFLARNEPILTSAIALRHLTASTRGGSMTGWIDACTALEGGELRYWIVAEGGSGTIRKRALVAALDGEIKARKEQVSRAALDPSNYEFAPEIAEDGLVRVGLTPRRKDTMLIEGAMFLSPEDADLVRLEGRLVKPPSFWTRQVNVVRRYGRSAGVRVPLSMESTAKVLIVGTSTFAMTYKYLSVNGSAVVAEAGPSPNPQVCGDGPAEARSTNATSKDVRPALPAATADPPRSAAEHHQTGVDFHLRHMLADASDEYAKTLALDPPRPPTADEERPVERFAPRIGKREKATSPLG